MAKRARFTLAMATGMGSITAVAVMQSTETAGGTQTPGTIVQSPGSSTTTTDESTASPPIPNATHYSPLSVVQLPDGGTSYSYLLNGQEITYNVPPSGFNALTASPTELTLYGIPQAPPPGPQLSEWQNFWDNNPTWPMPDLWVAPSPLSDHPINSASPDNPLPADNSNSVIAPQPDVTVNTEEVPNWGGYDGIAPNVTQTTDPNPIDEVDGYYTQPASLYTSCSGAQVGTWVGIGGDGNAFPKQDGLIQAGTVMYPGPTDKAFYEYLTGSNQGPNPIFFNLNVSPGDSMEANVVYNKNNNSAGYTVIDYTKSTSQSVSVPNQSAYYSGTTADAISERVVPNALYNYGTDAWQQVYADYYASSTDQYHGMGLYDYLDASIITDDGLKIYQHPDNMTSSSSFNMHWQNC